MKLSVTKGTVSQKAEVINQEKLFCWPESYNVKHIIDIKRPWGLRNCTKKKKKKIEDLTKSAVSGRFGHIYWRNPQWKISFFAQWEI